MKNIISLTLLFVLLSVILFSCKTASPGKLASDVGMASYYASKHAGKKTANGEVYRSNKLTAAHKTLPFGTSVKVTNLSNGKSVVVRINDRGPFAKGRIIDLSKAAARKIGMIKAGVTKVKIEYKRV